MSEAVSSSSDLPRTHMESARVRHNRLSALEALERGFALFRSTFAREAWRYYMGVAPLVLLFIPIWIINGQIRIGSGMLLSETLLLAGCYLVRVWMVSSYMRHVRERAFRSTMSESRRAQMSAMGRLLAWKIMLSAAALVALPTMAGAAWFYGACQFASFEAQTDESERHSFSGCLALAGQWFGSSVLLFLILIPFWVTVWLNSLILAIVFPQLLHSIVGVNTLISTQMGLFALITSSAFWVSLLVGTWLALDPVVKCTFVVVYQHLRSKREGDDLRGLLSSLQREHQKRAQVNAPRTMVGGVARGALFVLASILVGFSLTATAHGLQLSSVQGPAPDGSAREARIHTLRQALDHESQRAIYRWHDAEHLDPPSWFDKLLAKIAHGIDRAWNALWNFLRKLWPSEWNFSPADGKHDPGRLKDIRLWLFVIGIVTSATVAVLVWMRQRRRNVTSVTVPLEVAPFPDLNDAVVASERSEDEWFALADRLEGEGELRYALRATYLGLLAGLSQRQWLTIRRDHTNREYLNEFTRRWRRRPQAGVDLRAEIPETLRGSLRQFDRVWYGAHTVTPETVASYRQDQREFLNRV